MRSFRNEQRNRALSVAVGVGLTLSMAAAIADPSKSVTKADDPGVMKFEHVRVTSNPSSATKPSKALVSNGARAFVDANTLQQRDQTAEERIAEAAAQANASTGEASVGAQINLPDGGVGVEVPAETVIFQVAHKSKSGIVSAEAVGPAAADKAAKSKVVEVSHDR